jgi:acyl carrier protein
MVRERIQKFMEEAFQVKFGHDLEEDSDLFKAGVIDSFGYLKLIKHLEDEFEIKFSEEEILSNIFVTFSGIVECITQKAQARC